MSKKVILDASALLALIQKEKGAEIVEPLLKYAIMSVVNVAECLTALQRVRIPPQEAMEYISAIIATIIPFDLEQAQLVAELYPHVQHKGLSLGDRACITLGIKLQIPIYTADKIWSKLTIDQANINLIR